MIGRRDRCLVVESYERVRRQLLQLAGLFAQTQHFIVGRRQVEVDRCHWTLALTLLLLLIMMTRMAR